MSRILLDTSAYSAFLRGHAGVVQTIRQSEEISLNPVILGEMLAGFRKGNRQHRNEEELQRFLSSPRVNVVEINEETSERYAIIFDSLRRAGTPVASNDLWIAASAMQFGFRLVTLDTDFQRIPQILLELHEA
jgi:Predicted nucleic acid-binding protein, contains PIN domain